MELMENEWSPCALVILLHTNVKIEKNKNIIFIVTGIEFDSLRSSEILPFDIDQVNGLFFNVYTVLCVYCIVFSLQCTSSLKGLIKSCKRLKVYTIYLNCVMRNNITMLKSSWTMTKCTIQWVALLVHCIPLLCDA